jgi:hypothetical protein
MNEHTIAQKLNEIRNLLLELLEKNECDSSPQQPVSPEAVQGGISVAELRERLADTTLDPEARFVFCSYDGKFMQPIGWTDKNWVGDSKIIYLVGYNNLNQW